MADKNNKVKYNLKNAHYALLKISEDGTVSYGNPVAIPGSVPMTAVYWTDESKPTDETRETTFIPRTGDSSHSILWILVLTGSVAGLGVILVWGFRNRKNEK